MAFLTVKEIAERLRVCSVTVESWIKSGQLQAINVNGRGGPAGTRKYRIPAEALESFLQARDVRAREKAAAH